MVKKFDAIKIYEIAESGNTGHGSSHGGWFNTVAMTAFYLLTTTRCLNFEHSTAGLPRVLLP